MYNEIINNQFNISRKNEKVSFIAFNVRTSDNVCSEIWTRRSRDSYERYA